MIRRGSILFILIIPVSSFFILLLFCYFFAHTLNNKYIVYPLLHANYISPAIIVNNVVYFNLLFSTYFEFAYFYLIIKFCIATWRCGPCARCRPSGNGCYWRRTRRPAVPRLATVPALVATSPSAALQHAKASWASGVLVKAARFSRALTRVAVVGEGHVERHAPVAPPAEASRRHQTQHGSGVQVDGRLTETRALREVQRPLLRTFDTTHANVLCIQMLSPNTLLFKANVPLELINTCSQWRHVRNKAQ